MKRSSRNLMRACSAVCAYLTTLFLRADFSGPYALTPPAPGVYSGQQLSTNYGHWSVWRLQAAVNTSNAPARLVLEVPAYSFYANGLDFYTRAAASGTVSFDSTTISTLTGAIHWMRQPFGSNPTYVPLDGAPIGVPQHYEFPVQAGDMFGFSLGSGGCVVIRDDVWIHTLTVENFVAPLTPMLTLQSPTVLRWQGASNQVCTIQTTTNLFDSNWTTIATVPATTAEVCFTNLDLSAPQRFYRLTYP